MRADTTGALVLGFGTPRASNWISLHQAARLPKEHTGDADPQSPPVADPVAQAPARGTGRASRDHRGDLDAKALRGHLRLVRKGDLEAFDAVMRSFERRVWALAHRLLGDPDTARDCSQQVFLKLYRTRRRLDPARPLWPYLCTITANVCRDHWRRQKPEFPFDTVDSVGEGPGEGAPREHLIADPEADPERRYAGREAAEHLEQALRRLPEGERLAICLRDVEGLSTREIARALGNSPATIRSQISRGRVRLLELLEARAGTTRQSPRPGGQGK